MEVIIIDSRDSAEDLQKKIIAAGHVLTLAECELLLVDAHNAGFATKRFETLKELTKTTLKIKLNRSLGARLLIMTNQNRPLMRLRKSGGGK